MKLKFVYTFFCLSLLALILQGSANGRAFSAMAGNTGAPGDQKQGNGQPWTCKTCHSSNAFAAGVTIEVKDGNGNVINGYEPGTTYDVRVTVTHNGSAQEFGFQALSLIDNGNTEYNAWSSPAANVRLAIVDTSGRQYAEHFGPSATNTFDVQWTAPPAGSGSVTIYAGGNATNNNNMSSGDGANITSISLVETTGTPATIADKYNFSFNILENPVQDQLRIAVLSNEAANYQLSVQDLQGNILMQENLSLYAGQLNRTLDISRLSSGIYFARLSDGNNVKVRKFLKF